MNTNDNLCCGVVGPKRKIKIDKIPNNPKVINGVELVYIGAGVTKITGRKSKLVYFASDQRRNITVSPLDTNYILSKPVFILNAS